MKEPDQKRLILYQWIRLVKEICPNRITQNPFETEIQKLDFLSIEEQLLIKDVLHSLTLINSNSRINEEGNLISTQSDFLNALHLVIPNDLRLDEKVADFHHQLLQEFKNQSFTYLEAMVKLRITKSTLKRRLKPLLIRKLVVKLEETKTKKAEFVVRELSKTPIESSELTFDTMLGEWKDFVGFVEF
ncbi:MAG: hypothetical protein RIM99_15620 [Cyclobacteriaceae bacterium]